jgi:hypothetical protein
VMGVSLDDKLLLADDDSDDSLLEVDEVPAVDDSGVGVGLEIGVELSVTGALEEDAEEVSMEDDSDDDHSLLEVDGVPDVEDSNDGVGLGVGVITL